MQVWLAFLQLVTVIACVSPAAQAAANGEDQIRSQFKMNAHDAQILKEIMGSRRALLAGDQGLRELTEMALNNAELEAMGSGCATCGSSSLEIERALENALAQKDPRAQVIFDVAGPSLYSLYQDARSAQAQGQDLIIKSPAARYNFTFLMKFLPEALAGMGVAENNSLIRKIMMLNLPHLQVVALRSVVWKDSDGDFLRELAPQIKDPQLKNFLLLSVIPLLPNETGRAVTAELLRHQGAPYISRMTDLALVSPDLNELCDPKRRSVLVTLMDAVDDVGRSQFAHKVLIDRRCYTDRTLLNLYLDGAEKASLLTFVQSVLPLVDDAKELARKVADRIDWQDNLSVDIMVKLFMRERSAAWPDLLQAELVRAARIDYGLASSAWLRISRFPHWEQHSGLRRMTFRQHPWRSLTRGLKGEAFGFEDIVGFGPCAPYLK